MQKDLATEFTEVTEIRKEEEDEPRIARMNTDESIEYMAGYWIVK